MERAPLERRPIVKSEFSQIPSNRLQLLSSYSRGASVYLQLNSLNSPVLNGDIEIVQRGSVLEIFVSAPSQLFSDGGIGSSTVASDQRGLATLPAPCHFIFGPGVFSEPLLWPPGQAFPHSP